MNYYRFHIGDYRGATMHLTNEEDLAYRRLMDMYYDTEQPIPLDLAMVARRLRVALSDIETVVRDFLVETPEGYISKRANEEIDSYKTRQNAASNAGKASGDSRRKRGTSVEQPLNDGSASVERPLNACSGSVQHSLTDVEHPSTNQEPITNNQSNTPLIPLAGEKADTRKAEDAVIPEVLDTPAFREAWGKWLKYRRVEKRKKVSFGAAERHLENLAGHGEAAALAAIKRAMEGEWQGLHPERGRIENVRTETPAVQGVRDWSKEKRGSYL